MSDRDGDLAVNEVRDAILSWDEKIEIGHDIPFQRVISLPSRRTEHR